MPNKNYWLVEYAYIDEWEIIGVYDSIDKAMKAMIRYFIHNKSEREYCHRQLKEFYYTRIYYYPIRINEDMFFK